MYNTKTKTETVDSAPQLSYNNGTHTEWVMFCAEASCEIRSVIEAEE